MKEYIDSVLTIRDLGSGLESSSRDRLAMRLQLGEHLAISGPSGCGKTSLLLVLAGLRAPVSGSFCWQGQPICAESLRWWRQQFCYLPQLPVMGADNVGQVLRLPWQLKALTSKQPDDGRCREILEQLDLHHDLDVPVEQLSGGEKQRLAIARAWLMERPIWLLDEPTSALDPVSRNRVIELLSALPRISISVSHDPVWLKSSHYRHDMGGHHG
ncbi:ATP-binding cassette domain-containing protein [uncultured Photobacterium sp.]|uniref:ABC transporter ATP-binding protein n=1 Tax=uncultured Photobacterium sp. TaxID=173973 RepID=UPI002636B057|nr:ATP-binding cassette domain-containing protein [uncultured Photobacterium sp.]